MLKENEVLVFREIYINQKFHLLPDTNQILTDAVLINEFLLI